MKIFVLLRIALLSVLLSYGIIATAQELIVQQKHTGKINQRALSPTGEIYATASADKTIKIWDIKTKKLIKTITGFSFFVDRVKFSPDGKYLISRGDIGLCRLWDTQTWKEIIVLKGFFKPITSLLFSENGKLLFSGNMDGLFHVMDMETEKSYEFSESAAVDIVSMSFENEGKTIRYMRKKDEKSHLLPIETFLAQNKLWDKFSEPLKVEKMATESERDAFARKFERDIIESTIFNKLEFNDEGSLLFMANLKGEIYYWNLKTNKIEKIVDEGRPIYDLKYSQKEHLLYYCGDFNEIKALSLKTGQIEKNINNQEAAVSIDIINGKIAACSKYGKIKIWENAGDRKLLHDFDVSTSKKKYKAKQIKFTNDGSKILCSLDNKIYVTKLKGLKFLYSIQYKDLGDFVLDFEDKKVYAINMKKDLKVWDLKKGEKLDSYRDPFPVRTASSEFKSHPVAIHPNGSVIVHESENWSMLVRKTTSMGKYNVLKGHSSIINDIDISNKGIVASAGRDATVRIWNASSGEKITTLVLSGDEHIIVGRENYYVTTRQGYELVAFNLNNKIYPFEQFDLQYNRPDLVLSHLGFADKDLMKMYHSAYQKRLQKLGFNESMFSDNWHLPAIEILNEAQIPVDAESAQLELQLLAKDDKFKLDRINVWVNDVPVLGVNGLDLKKENTTEIRKDIEIKLSRGKNKIQVSVHNSKTVESYKETVYVNYRPKEKSKPDLYFVGIGISEYENEANNLRFADKDAKDLMDLYKTNSSAYENVYLIPLLNKDATKENILKLKEKLMKTKVDDQVMVFFAGHGVFGEDDNYYLANTDINNFDISGSALAYTEFETLLDGIPARNKLLFIDACHSGEADDEESFVPENVGEDNRNLKVTHLKRDVFSSNAKLGKQNSFELMKMIFADLRRGTGATVISSAGAGEYALEGGSIKNGIFTYVVLKALKNAEADSNSDKKVSVSELRDYVFDKVAKYTKGAQHPTSRRENLTVDFRVW